MKKTGIAILLAALLFGQTAAAAVYEGQVQETEIQTEAYEEAQAPAEDRETELILPGGTNEEQEIGEEGSRETETTEAETDPASATEPADDFILSIEVSRRDDDIGVNVVSKFIYSSFCIHNYLFLSYNPLRFCG